MKLSLQILMQRGWPYDGRFTPLRLGRCSRGRVLRLPRGLCQLLPTGFVDLFGRLLRLSGSVLWRTNRWLRLCGSLRILKHRGLPQHTGNRLERIKRVDRAVEQAFVD